MGAVLIAKKGEIIFQKAYGYSNIGKKIKNRVDTKYRIGSITDLALLGTVKNLDKGTVTSLQGGTLNNLVSGTVTVGVGTITTGSD